MNIHAKTLVIKKNTAEKFNDWMSQSVVDLDMECLPHMGNVETWTVEFEKDNKIFDLRVNTSDDDVWCEGILLVKDDERNCYFEYAVSDVRDNLYGTYAFDTDDGEYIVKVVDEDSNNNKDDKIVNKGLEKKYLALYVDHGETCDGKPDVLGLYKDYQSAKDAIYDDMLLWQKNHEKDCEGEFDISLNKMSAWDKDDYNYGCEWKIIDLEKYL